MVVDAGQRAAGLFLLHLPSIPPQQILIGLRRAILCLLLLNTFFLVDFA